MKRKMIRRGLAALLCMTMLLSLPALAVFEEDEIPEVPAVSEMDTVAELPELPVEAPSDNDPFEEQAQPMASTVFSVTVPTTVAIHMDASGGITCGDIVITNNSTDAVLIKDTQMSALNGWALVDYATTTFTDANKGQHKIALQLSAVDGAISANGGSKTIGVSAKIPHQGGQITNASIAQAVFVLGWEVPPAAPSVTLKEFSIVITEEVNTRFGQTLYPSCTVTLSYVSHGGDTALYEGRCTLSAPDATHNVYLPIASNIPPSIVSGVRNITAGSATFSKDDTGNTWTGSTRLFEIYSSGVSNLLVQVEVDLNIACSVQSPSPSTLSPSPTSTATPAPT